MRDLNQSVIKFNYEQNFTYDDFYISKSNKHIFKQLNKCVTHTATFSDGMIRWNWPPHSFFNQSNF